MTQSLFKKNKTPTLHAIIGVEGCNNSALGLLTYVLVTPSHPPPQVIMAAPPCNMAQGLKS